ncbi:MAG: hypothetical protein IJS32_06090 [Kiritimatiellae bacterium]|nr:hypothetical protein [Kiritimatiellia bacterium]
MNARRLLSSLCAAGVGAVFVLAALPKLQDPATFALAVYRYHLLPGALVNLAAMAMPWTEILTGAALIAGRGTLRRAGALLAAAMLVIFTSAIALSLARGLDIACGCFSLSPAAAAAGWKNLVRNAFLFAACLPPLLLRLPQEK